MYVELIIIQSYAFIRMTAWRLRKMTNEELKETLKSWIELLSKDGANTKSQVKLQIQAVLYQLENEVKDNG